LEKVARRAVDDDEAAFLSLHEKSHYDRDISPSKASRLGLLSQELAWDINKSTEVAQNMTLKDGSTPQVPEGGNKVEGIAEWMINQCEIDPENARRYAAALVDIGCDRLKDLVEVDQEDWPIQVKKIHLKKILKALSLNLHLARPLSGVSTGFSANSSHRGLDGGPYQPSGSKSPKRYFPFSTRSGYPEPAAGNVRDPSQFFDDVPLGLHARSAPHNSPMRDLGGTLGRRPMAGPNMSHETLERNPYAFAGSHSLDNTSRSLVQPLHNRWRYQPTSREHGHMSSMYARVQMPERGSLVHSGFSLDTSNSPLRRHYSATHDSQRDRTPGHSDRELADLVYAGTQVSERSRRFTLLDWR